MDKLIRSLSSLLVACTVLLASNSHALGEPYLIETFVYMQGIKYNYTSCGMSNTFNGISLARYCGRTAAEAQAALKAYYGPKYAKSECTTGGTYWAPRGASTSTTEQIYYVDPSSANCQFYSQTKDGGFVAGANRGASVAVAMCNAKYPVVSGSSCVCPSGIWNASGQCIKDVLPEDEDGAPPCNEACGDGINSGANKGVGDPINLVTGKVYFSETDLVIKTPGTPLEIKRYFGSRSTGSLGNWRLGFDLRKQFIDEQPPQYPVLRQEHWFTLTDGRRIRFRLTGEPINDPTYALIGESVDGVQQYALLRPDGTRDQFGSLYDWTAKSSTYPTGEVINYEYDTSWRLSRITDSHGNIVDFTYSGTRVTGVRVNGIDMISYGYDSSNRLVSVTWADGTSRSYTYGNSAFANVVTESRNEKGELVGTWTYDAAGRAVSAGQGGVGDAVTIERPVGGPVVVNYPSGRVERYHLEYRNGRAFVGKKERTAGGVTDVYTTEYDSLGLPKRTVDWRGVVTEYVYDANGLEISRREAVGTPEQRVVSTTWDTATRLPTSETDAFRRIDYTYNNRTLVAVRETDLTAFNAGERTKTYAWDGLGRLLSIDGPRTDVADVTIYQYVDGRMASVTDAVGNVTRYTEWNALGLPVSVINQNALLETYAYDVRGRVTGHSLHAPERTYTTSFAYDIAGNIASITGPDGTAYAYEHDRHGRVMSVEDPAGNRVEYVRNAEGLVTGQAVRDSSGTLRSRQDYLYDQLRRLTQVSGAAGVRAAYQTDRVGNVTNVADGLGNGLAQTFDALGRLVASLDAVNAATGMGYDADDNLASVTDARGLQTRYEYDGFGCLRRQISPDTGLTEFTCDKAGNVVSRTDARGVTTTYAYDAVGRRMSAVHSGAQTEVAFYGYDDVAGGNFGRGRLTAAQNADADMALRYDARGNVVEDRRVFGGRTYVTRYAWDDAGRLASVTYPSGRVVAYLRDTAGTVSGVTQQAPGGVPEVVASNIGWQAFGGLAGLTYGNGLVESRDYDLDGALTGITVGGLLSRTYARDAAGRITSITDANPQDSEAYTYSNVDRLTAASGPYGTRTYSYDGVGNRLTQSENGNESSYAYGATSNRLYQITGVDAASLDYDSVGNTLAKNELSFTYNAANRLSSVTVPGAEGPETVSFAYTALGERVVKSGPSGTTHFHYDLYGHLLAETDADGNAVREYIWLGNTPIGLVARRNGGEAAELFAVHTDHLDTALALTDSAQAFVWRYNREPFGDLVAGNNTVRWPLRFPGQYEDSETGLYYNYFRDYDPATGRYVESDPIGLEGGANTYGYVGGNPVLLVDPLGLVDPCLLYKNCTKAGRPAPDVGGGGCSVANKAGQAVVRTTRSGDKAVRITKPDGSVVDISSKRVKEYVPNTHPKAPPGTLDKVKFPNAQPGSKGYKRDPTADELETLRNAQ